MKYANHVFLVLLVLVAAAVLHYTLPRNDIVRIIGTEVRRVDMGETTRLFWAQSDAGTAARDSRDVRFIETIDPDGDPIVYRNEDTGWGWPPFLKFDASNLQARATDLVSTRDDPEWVAVRHYGWRSEWFSIFPNALEVTPVEGPDAQIFPWRAVMWLCIFLAVLLGIGVLLRLFVLTVIDPLRERVRGGPRR